MSGIISVKMCVALRGHSSVPVLPEVDVFSTCDIT